MNAPVAQTDPAMPPEILALQGEGLQPAGRNKTVADYVAQAGGTRKEADRRSMYVLRADGSVISNQGSFFSSSLNGARLMPGDAIVVPEDLTRTTWMKDLKDWTQIFYQFGLGAAAIKIIRD